jgi:hypothetical protein
LGLHQQEFKVIGCPQVLGNPRLAHRLFPQHTASLTTQAIPALLVVVYDSPDKIDIIGFNQS